MIVRQRTRRKTFFVVLLLAGALCLGGVFAAEPARLRA